MQKIAIILSGCGVFDGSEISETVLTLLALEQHNLDYAAFAPNIDQHCTHNHLANETTDEKRNVLIESARITRGKIQDLKDADPNEFSGIIIPGGFGAVQNLCDFAIEHRNMSVLPDLQRFVQTLYEQKKPLGFICIAPALITRILGSNITFTIGNDEKIRNEVTAMGGNPVDCASDDIVIDTQHNIVSTPAFMNAKSLNEIYRGVTKLAAFFAEQII